jgi:ribosomal protein S18 acetylase RimI-like enzyme
MTPTAPALRQVQPNDEPFLFQVYASTRLEQLAPLGRSLEQQHAFLTQQFNAQHQYYQANYASADFQLILVNGQPAGRLYHNRAINEIRIIDIALLPEYRNGGIGSALLNSLLVEAALEGKCVSIHV